MKAVVIGSSGLVGSRYLELSTFKTFLIAPSHQELDICDKNSIWAFLREHNPDYLVNFAAYTNVSDAQKQKGDKRGECWKLNVTAVENLLSCIGTKTRLIQISTDMVFSGSENDRGPYPESHPPSLDSEKVTWYGFTKAQAEKKIEETLGNTAVIFRLIYPVRAKFPKKLDYLRKSLKLFDEGNLYPIFTDQHVSISFADEACLALDKIIVQKATGIFHAGSEDTTTPYELVSYLLEKARGVKNAVKPVSLDEFLKSVDNPVRYPKFGGLRVEETERRLGIKFGTWKEIIDKLVEQGIRV